MPVKFDILLKSFRSRVGATQEEFVELLQRQPEYERLTAVSYHRWESGKVSPPLKKQAQILLLLNANTELAELCASSIVFLQSFKKQLSLRWGGSFEGVDNCYDSIFEEHIAIKDVSGYDNFPEEAKALQAKLYDNFDENIQINIEKLLQDSSRNFAFIAQQNERLYGQLAFHLISPLKLQDYFEQMHYNVINPTLTMAENNEKEDVLFLSSFHSSKKSVYLSFVKILIETTLTFTKIPKYTFFRLYSAPFNNLFVENFNPILISTGGRNYARVKLHNKNYDWLGYLIPTHLLLLGYGSVLEELSF
ncbi:hypothetical protein A9267_17135 [Shewanella sp. UCD-FRSSP16_17]|uniref:helix-turn-helix domain-containing protein n=1 Tax=Shewanella sp. UCD-FRSSP16_17 TaxID=1853256 RepID=UPI0007EEF1DB|nr:helix-turn-helix domain-containing protein [Shewanella sp. UCD-FRSSP16_17]OBT04673.1 hypothetical protein A9267_17135 [Shewanella sp. UCD-FRSSP16_17]